MNLTLIIVKDAIEGFLMKNVKHVLDFMRICF